MIVRKLLSSVLILALFVSVLSFTGCHGSRDRNEFEVPESFDEERATEITFWAKNDTNLTQVAIYKQAIADFEELYPNVKVNLKLYTDYGRIYSDVITNISTDTTPNVCITYPDHIATYMTGDNVIVPLDALINDENYGLGADGVKFDSPTKDEIIPEFLSECMIGSTYYAMPYMRSTEACYINKTYVEALGFELPEMLTWEFIWEVCAAAMKKDENGNFLVNGQSIMIPIIYKSTDNMMIQMLKQSAADYSTVSGDVLIFNDDTKDILYMVAEHTANAEFSTFKISSYPGNYLNAGQCIFAIDSTAGATWMGSDAPLMDIHETEIVDFETAVMGIPQCDPSNVKMISQGPSVCIFNKSDPQDVLASWLFVQYLLTNDVQIAYAQTEGYVPVTSKAQNSDEYQDYLSRSGENNSMYYSIKLDATKLLLDNTANTFVTPVFNGSASLRDAAGQMIEEVAKSVRRGQTVDEDYINALYAKINSLYKLDQINRDPSVMVDQGPLPTGSVVLISVLAVAWVGIGSYTAYKYISKQKKSSGT